MLSSPINFSFGTNTALKGIWIEFGYIRFGTWTYENKQECGMWYGLHTNSCDFAFNLTDYYIQIQKPHSTELVHLGANK